MKGKVFVAQETVNRDIQDAQDSPLPILYILFIPVKRGLFRVRLPPVL